MTPGGRFIRRTLLYLSLAGLTSCLIASAFSAFKLVEGNHYIDELIDTAVHQKGLRDTDAIALALSSEIHRRANRLLNPDRLDWYTRLEAESFFNISSAGVLKYGGFGIIGDSDLGPCGTMSRTLLNALWRLEIPARKLQLLHNAEGKGGGHTMIEFYHRGRWMVLSPSDNFAWRNRNGEIATLREIRQDSEVFSQIYAVDPQFRYLFDNPSNIRWEKLPASIVAVLQLVMGPERFRTAQTPKLYDQPRKLLLLTFLSASLFFAAVSFMLSAKARGALSRSRRHQAGRDAAATHGSPQSLLP